MRAGASKIFACVVFFNYKRSVTSHGKENEQKRSRLQKARTHTQTLYVLSNATAERKTFTNTKNFSATNIMKVLPSLVMRRPF